MEPLTARGVRACRGGLLRSYAAAFGKEWQKESPAAKKEDVKEFKKAVAEDADAVAGERCAA
jgi:hypothetical protein